MQNRQKDEVVRDILQSAMGEGTGISRIMFGAALSHSQATAYLSKLMDGGFIENDVEMGRMHYRTTPKGVEYLRGLNQMYELLHV